MFLTVSATRWSLFWAYKQSPFSTSSDHRSPISAPPWTSTAARTSNPFRRTSTLLDNRQRRIQPSPPEPLGLKFKKSQARCKLQNNLVCLVFEFCILEASTGTKGGRSYPEPRASACRRLVAACPRSVPDIA
eukprot:1842043-Rhodomonas_salina.3